MKSVRNGKHFIRFLFIIHRYFVLRSLNYFMMENMLSWTYKKFITHELTYLNLYLYYGCECVIEKNIFLLLFLFPPRPLQLLSVYQIYCDWNFHLTQVNLFHKNEIDMEINCQTMNMTKKNKKRPSKINVCVYVHINVSPLEFI